MAKVRISWYRTSVHDTAECPPYKKWPAPNGGGPKAAPLGRQSSFGEDLHSHLVARHGVSLHRLGLGLLDRKALKALLCLSVLDSKGDRIDLGRLAREEKPPARCG